MNLLFVGVPEPPLMSIALLHAAGDKVPVELKLKTKSAEFVVVTWNVSNFDEHKVLTWIVNYRVV